MKNIKLIINHDVSFTDDFTKDVLNEFPDEIENKYIGLLNTTQNFHSYKYDIEYLCKNYKAITGKNFKAPRSKISWRKY